jgi:hypothetical protein
MDRNKREEMSDPQQQESNRNEDGTFKEGVSGNPGGRPKGSVSLKTLIQQKIAEVPIGQTKAWAEQIVETLLEKAVVDKDVAAQKLIINYVDGMPIQTTELTGKDGTDLFAPSERIKELAKKLKDA